MPTKYFQLETKGKRADIYIFGKITTWDEYDKKAQNGYTIVKTIEELDVDEIHVHINSPGGSVAEGLAIYNILKNNKAKITTYCDGFACSAASVIFMAGEQRIMNEASLLMIHNAWSYGSGNAKAFRKQADDLEKITQASVNAYVRNSTISEEKIKQMMDAETWITAAEAKEYGFATKVYEDEDDDVNQSAMKSIRDRILQKEIAPAQVSINAEKIADVIAEKVTNSLKAKEESHKDKYSWDAFFGTGE